MRDLYLKTIQDTCKEIPSEIKELGIHQLAELLELVSLYGDPVLVTPMLPAFERRFFDLRLDLIETSQMADFASFFSILNYQSDSFWEFASEILFNNFDGLATDDRIKAVRAFSTVKRGSDTLWNRFFTLTLSNHTADEIARDAAIIRAAIEVGYDKNHQSIKNISTSDIIEKLSEAEVI